jgi:hypothetical protein
MIDVCSMNEKQLHYFHMPLSRSVVNWSVAARYFSLLRIYLESSAFTQSPLSILLVTLTIFPDWHAPKRECSKSSSSRFCERLLAVLLLQMWSGWL